MILPILDHDPIEKAPVFEAHGPSLEASGGRA
jgi:hypothetical protein